MSYRWQPGAGVYGIRDLEEAQLLPGFDSQASAEEWLSLWYEELLEHGVTEVTLYEAERPVYGPMPLTP